MHDSEYVESLNNLGRAFSGRGFIWSRTLPLLKDNILLGTGPDTFLLAFPNDDYVAMSNGGYATELITKPHNMYLQIAVQTGVLSLICFLVFYFWYFFSSLRLYRKADKSKYLPLVGIGILCGTFGYMVVGIINDSMVVISPLYWTMIGIGLAINFMIKRDNIFPVVDEVKAVSDSKSKDKGISNTEEDGADNEPIMSESTDYSEDAVNSDTETISEVSTENSSQNNNRSTKNRKKKKH